MTRQSNNFTRSSYARQVPRGIPRGSISLVLLFAFVLLGAQMAFASATHSVNINFDQVFNYSGSATVSKIVPYVLTSSDPGNPLPGYPQGSSGIPSSTKLVVDGTRSASVGPLVFNKVGVYSYTLKADLSALSPGYSFDPTEYKVTVFIRNEAGGLDSSTVWEKQGTKVDEVKFEHGYDATPTDPLAFTDTKIVKTVVGDDPPQDETFSFELKAADENNPMPDGKYGGTKQVTITGNGETTFGSWVYTKEGTYYYTVSEVKGNTKGYIYDPSVYTIIHEVSDKNGQLQVNQVIQNSEKFEVTTLDFQNVYDKSLVDPNVDDPDPDPGRKKPGGGTQSIKDGPKTGDYSNPLAFLALMAVGGTSAIGSGGYLVYDKRKKEKLNK